MDYNQWMQPHPLLPDSVQQIHQESRATTDDWKDQSRSSQPTQPASSLDISDFTTLGDIPGE